MSSATSTFGALPSAPIFGAINDHITAPPLSPQATVGPFEFFSVSGDMSRISSQSSAPAMAPRRVRHTPRLPRAVMYQNVARQAPMVPCMVCGRHVRSGIPHTVCFTHRNNLSPSSGWVHLTSSEFSIINNMRRFRMTRRVARILDAMVTSDDEESTSGSGSDDDTPSIISLADATDEMDLSSSDEL